METDASKVPALSRALMDTSPPPTSVELTIAVQLDSIRRVAMLLDVHRLGVPTWRAVEARS